MSEESRPDPDAILRRIQAEAQRESRARLKIYLGFAPGVGKTFAMLERARELAAAGEDVVVGWVDTHGRYDTAALLLGLEILPRRRVAYRERELAGVRPRRGARAQARRAPARRARAHERAGRAPRQALAGRRGAARRRHRGPHHAQHPARREPERRGGADHRACACARRCPTRSSIARTRSCSSTSSPRSCSCACARARSTWASTPSAPRAASSGAATCSRCASWRCVAPPSASTWTCRRTAREHGIATSWPVGRAHPGVRGRCRRRRRSWYAPRAASRRACARRGSRPGSSARRRPGCRREDREQLEANLRLAETLGASVVRLVGARPSEAILDVRARAQHLAHRDRQAHPRALARSLARRAARRGGARQRRRSTCT